MDKVVALPAALTDARKYRISAVILGYVVNKLHYKDRLADAGAAEQTYLSALGIGGKKVNDLYAGFKKLGFGTELLKGRRRTVYPPFFALNGLASVYRVA